MTTIWQQRVFMSMNVYSWPVGGASLDDQLSVVQCARSETASGLSNIKKIVIMIKEHYSGGVPLNNVPS